ncbi:MAG: ATP-binding protein [Myxococcales bacterium]|nr:ATP-binding protein [Myxococcales bacterium]
MERLSSQPIAAASSLPATLEPANSLLPTSPSPEDERRAVTRLQLFMGTRLGVATLLLGGTLLITLEDSRGFDSFTPQFLVSLIAAIYGASLIFAVWLLGSTQRDRVALAQVGTDLVVTTGLVYVTGGSGSGFTFLYGVAVLMAAMVVGPLSARVTGATAITLYGLLSVSLAQGWVPPPADQPAEAYLLSLGELAYAGLLNVLGLLLVTVLAGNLSARLLTTGGQLRLAEASAATLARLNDDIVRSLSSGVLTTDLEGRIRTINPAGVEMFGLDADRFIGVPVDKLLDIDVAPMLMPTGADQTITIARAESTARRPNGERFPIGYSMNQLVNIDGAAIGALVMFQDLSEITRLRDRAARQERLAVLGRLSAGLAHEIRNPLGSISGSVQLVRESKELEGEDRDLLGIVLNEVDRLNDLVSTMLSVGKPHEPQRRDEDLRATVETVVEMARRGPAETKDVTIERQVPDHPVIAFVDGDQVRQVMWNLVKNALQASPEGATVWVSAETSADGSAVLRVQDQGEGLDAAQQEKVYNMFYSERTHGAGIGLALVRQIVDAHGGTIEIESEENAGATFIVTLPRGSEHSRDDEDEGERRGSGSDPASLPA